MNFSNLSNFSAPSPSFSSPSPSSFQSPSPSSSPSSSNIYNPSPVSDTTTPSPETAFPSSSPSYESLNHTSSLSSLTTEGEVNFFLAYVGISFCVVLIFGYFARKHIYGLLYDSRSYVNDLELPVRKQKYGVLPAAGESKEVYGQFAQLDELDEHANNVEHKSREVDQADCV